MTDKLDIDVVRKHLLPALRTTVYVTLKQALDELEDARKWINDLQSDMYINCVYCGHRYGPKDKIPYAIADVLREHIAKCPKHPLSAANKRIAELEEYQQKYSDIVTSCRNANTLRCFCGAHISYITD